eukprot:m.12251 g.12251  ORF g.12251 m.12251 type:complete len:265 (+) comp3971_c0_seq1:158-952(+)
MEHKKRGGPPKNFLAANKKEVREKEQSLREKKRHEAVMSAKTPSRLGTHNPAYKDVKSRFHQRAAEKGHSDTKQEFLKKHEINGKPSSVHNPQTGQSFEEKYKKKSKQAFGYTLSKNDEQALSIMGKAQSRPSSRGGDMSVSGSRTASRPGTAESRRKKGHELPKYLIRMKEERKEKQRLEEDRLKDPRCPTGYKPVSSFCLHRIVEQLRERKAKLSTHLQMLPVSRDTLRLREYKASLEEDIVQIDVAIKHLKANKVYVPSQT